MIHVFEGAARLLLGDPGSHGWFYDYMDGDGKTTWILSTNGGPERPPDACRCAIPATKGSPENFTKRVASLLMHAAEQSEVPEVEPVKVLTVLRSQLPRKDGLQGLLLRAHTLQKLLEASERAEKGLTRRGPCRPWEHFWQVFYSLPHVFFSNRVPKGMIVGVVHPENVGVATYNYAPMLRMGAMVVERGVRAVQITEA